MEIIRHSASWLAYLTCLARTTRPDFRSTIYESINNFDCSFTTDAIGRNADMAAQQGMGVLPKRWARTSFSSSGVADGDEPHLIRSQTALSGYLILKGHAKRSHIAGSLGVG